MIDDDWARVEEVMPGALGIAFDGCHKIYLAMDEGQVAEFRQLGYGDGSDKSKLITDLLTQDEKFETVKHWYRNSACGLRAVTSFTTLPDGAVDFEQLIRQFAEDDEAVPA